MAEGGGLLNRYTPQRRIEGSNPLRLRQRLRRIPLRISSRCRADEVKQRRFPRALFRMVDCRGKHDLWSFSAKVTPRVELISSISHWQIMTTPVGGGRPWSRYGCVVFTQHPPEKCRQPLWEAPFFIAWRGSSINVTKRRRGGIPLLCCPGY